MKRKSSRDPGYSNMVIEMIHIILQSRNVMRGLLIGALRRSKKSSPEPFSGLKVGSIRWFTNRLMKGRCRMGVVLELC